MKDHLLYVSTNYCWKESNSFLGSIDLSSQLSFIDHATKRPSNVNVNVKCDKLPESCATVPVYVNAAIRFGWHHSFREQL